MSRLKRTVILLIGLVVCVTCLAQDSDIESADAIVDPDGKSGAFTTIEAALQAASGSSADRYVILLKPGVYREKLRIERAGVVLQGSGPEQSVISWGDTGSDAEARGWPEATAGSATVTVTAPRVTFLDLTVENSFDYPANAALPDGSPNKVERMQAVALYTTGASDQALFRNVTFKGYQDTLFVDQGRHYFENCRVQGHVDFIFGAGQAVFVGCDIISLNRAYKNPTGYVTAPSTLAADPFGLLFLNCRFLKEPDVAPGSVRLGRPWHPGGNPAVEGSAVIMYSFMDDHLGEEGYAPISARNPAGERVWFEVGEDSRFFEYENHGPGAVQSDSRPRLDEQEAGRYTISNVLGGWDPKGKSQ